MSVQCGRQPQRCVLRGEVEEMDHQEGMFVCTMAGYCEQEIPDGRDANDGLRTFLRDSMRLREYI